MHVLTEFELESGGSVLVEIPVEQPKGSVAPAGKSTTKKAKKKLEEALSDIKPVASTLFSSLSSLAPMPDEVTAEFGVRLSAETGVVVTTVTGEVHYKISLTWKRSPVSES